MKIVGFAQLRNEEQKGNLDNWFRCMFDVCDKIYIFDQASDDNSVEKYKEYSARFPNRLAVVISETNNFSNEVGCKHFLLKLLLEREPDTNWIFWMDGDTVLDGRLLRGNLRKLCQQYYHTKVDALSLGHYNLWRSAIWYRTDDSYHGLHGGVHALWKNNGRLHFPSSGGLHQRVIPLGLDNFQQVLPYSLIHRGFATDYQIMTKYDVYGSRGQNGWALDRLLNEEGLTVEQIPSEVLPPWYDASDSTNPIEKERIRQIYERVHSSRA